MAQREDPFADFREVVTSLDQLREHVREPVPAVLAKVIDHIDPLCRRIIASSPFAVMSSATAQGYPDISPKGDPAGFVRVLGERHIAIPDRPGNRRLDTFHNLLENPYLAVIFLIPGRGETLRVSGECRIVRDRSLRESMAVDGCVPEFAIVMHVERVLVHCPKCVIRAQLWEPDAWPDTSGTPTIGEAMIAHARLNTTPAELEAQAEKDGLTRLY